MRVVILAGGVGSRMGDLVKDVPKPMVRLAGKPIMEYQIELASRYGLTEVHVLSGYKGDALERYFGDGGRWGVSIAHHREDTPLGTAGAVKELDGKLDRDFIVFYGDVYMDVDLEGLMDFHRRERATATIAVHPNDHPFDSDLVEVDRTDRVLAIHNKPHDPSVPRRNLVSAALYVLSPGVLAHIEQGRSSDFGRQVFPKLLSEGEVIRAYQTRDYIKDVGTVRRLEEVAADLAADRPRMFNQESRIGAVFLDRDGVLNHPDEPLRTARQMRLLPGVSAALKRINASTRLAVVVTNQPLIAKGFATESDLESIHGRMEVLLSEQGSYVDRIYYCPHHPESGHSGERPELKIRCTCRKPKTGLIDRAVAEMNIDPTDSFLVGDRTVDIQAGESAGIATILVRSGCGGRDGIEACVPDFIFDDLQEAADFLLDIYPRLLAKVDELLTGKVIAGRVIAIGGLSRSGKSTLAGVLVAALRKRAIPARRMNLDDWLVGLSGREVGMGVRDRYPYAQIADTLKRVLSGETVHFQAYDPLSRERKDQTDSLRLRQGDVLIVDGVVSLDVAEVRDAASLSIYTEIAESVRKVRMTSFYAQKGVPDAKVEELYQTRKVDEEPIVVASRDFADAILDMGTLT